MESTDNEAEISVMQVNAADPEMPPLSAPEPRSSITTICEEQQTNEVPGTNYSNAAPLLVSTPIYTRPPPSSEGMASMPAGNTKRTTAIASTSDALTDSNLGGDRFDDRVIIWKVLMLLIFWTLLCYPIIIVLAMMQLVFWSLFWILSRYNPLNFAYTQFRDFERQTDPELSSVSLTVV